MALIRRPPIGGGARAGNDVVAPFEDASCQSLAQRGSLFFRRKNRRATLDKHTMDIDPMESATAVENEAGGREQAGRLGSWVAITVALLATFLGVCKVKDDNVVQAMQQAQADKLDHWNFYQARNVREELAQATADQLKLAAVGAPPAQQANYREMVATYERLAATQAAKKEELRKQAGLDQQTYDALNYHDDQFDLSDTLVAMAISMLALTALTHKKWLYWAALVPTASGVVMGMAGLFGWQIHPDAFARLLS